MPEPAEGGVRRNAAAAALIVLIIKKHSRSNCKSKDVNLYDTR